MKKTFGFYEWVSQLMAEEIDLTEGEGSVSPRIRSLVKTIYGREINWHSDDEACEALDVVVLVHLIHWISSRPLDDVALYLRHKKGNMEQLSEVLNSFTEEVLQFEQWHEDLSFFHHRQPEHQQQVECI